MRLIDADALIADCNIYNAWDAQIVKDVVKAWTDDQPTIDAEPVRHGHWEFKDDFGNRNYDFIAVCSQCGNKENASGYSHSEWISEWRYCNACGAKMFGVNE